MIQLDERSARSFLESNGISADCRVVKIAGDASFRSYYRIFTSDKNFILMFAPPGYEETEPFIKIDNFLVLNGFSAPRIFASDKELGFLLLEDLGDDTYGKILLNNCDKKKELSLYLKACDCLLELHKINDSCDAELYNHATLFREVMLFVDWYLLLQKKEMNLQDRANFKLLWFSLFDQLGYLSSIREYHKKDHNRVLVLRDYHADNLMLLPDREGFKQVGLLDFQDAVVGSKAYDLVSLLEDARRDVDEENRAKVFDYYVQRLNSDKESFMRDYEILSLQRNIKIVGIFSRLSLRDGKHSYLKLLPRVIDFIKLRLDSKSAILADISQLLKKYI